MSISRLDGTLNVRRPEGVGTASDNRIGVKRLSTHLPHKTRTARRYLLAVLFVGYVFYTRYTERSIESRAPPVSERTMSIAAEESRVYTGLDGV